MRSTNSIVALDRTVVDGLPTTSATRTIIELLADGTVEEACDALDSAIRMRLTAHAVIARRLDELGRRGRAGVALFDEIVRAGLVESGLERRFVHVVRTAGLPEPIVQRRYRLDGVGTVRVDYELPGTPIVVEVGGRRGYLSAGERQQKERRRNALQLHGKVVYFFTTADVTEAPDRMVATLAAALDLVRVTDRCA